MTVGYGFGMLAVGLVAIAIAATIFFLVIGKMEKMKQEVEQKKEMEKKYGFK